MGRINSLMTGPARCQKKKKTVTQIGISHFFVVSTFFTRRSPRHRRAQALLEKAPIYTESVAESSSSTVTSLYCSKAHFEPFLAPGYQD